MSKLTWICILVLFVATVGTLGKKKEKAKTSSMRDTERTMKKEDEALTEIIKQLGKTEKERNKNSTAKNAKSPVKQLKEDAEKNQTYEERIKEAPKEYKGPNGTQAILYAVQGLNGSAASRSGMPTPMKLAFDTMNNMGKIIGTLGKAEDFVCWKTVCDKKHILKDWMKAIPDDRRLIDMSLPGTHNTMALHDSWSAGFVQCQTMSLKEQLNTGIRVLDIRCRHYQNAFPVHHAIIYQDAYFGRDVLKVCVDFLQENPSETIIINMQQASGADPEGNTQSFRKTYRDTINNYGSQNFIDLRRTRGYVTMGKARGKIVVNTAGLKFNQGQKVEQNEWEETFGEKSASITQNMKDAYATPDNENKLFVNYLSCSNWKQLATPGKQAVIQNHMAGQLVAMLKLSAGRARRVGIVFTDYPGFELIDRIVNSN